MEETFNPFYQRHLGLVRAVALARVGDVALADDLTQETMLAAWKSFAVLQKRLGRKNPSKKILADTPVIFLAYDVLELAGQDLRDLPLFERRNKLHRLIYAIPNNTVLQLSDIVRAPSWPTLALAREESRQRGTEGLMLKRRDSVYGVGRAKGSWWKWKVAPMTVDAVLVYAQRGHGKRASLYTDYTFAIWQASGMKKNWCHSPKLTRA